MTQTAVHRVRALAPRGSGSFVLRVVVLPYLYVSLLFYALVQLQDALVGRVYVMHQHVRTVGLVGALVATSAYLLRKQNLRIRRPRLVALALAFCAFVVVDFGVKVARGSIHASAAAYGETYLYFFAFLIPLMLLMSDNEVSVGAVFTERGAFRALYLLAVPIFLLGYAQVLLNKPILTLGDEAAGYVVEVPSRTDIGQIRAFSAFGSAFTYGHFITLVATLAVSYLLLRRASRRRVIFVCLFVASLLAAASTLTRNTYLELAVSVGAVLLLPRLLKRGWSNRMVIGASAVLAATVYGLLVGFFFATHLNARGLFNLSTFEVRLTSTALVFARYVLGGGTGAALLGQGYIQGEKFAALQGIHPLLFDNTYLDVMLFSGVVGLIFFLAFFVALFAYVLDRFRQTGAYWWLALSGMYASYFLVAAINIHTSTLYLLTSMTIAYDMLARRALAHPRSRTAPIGAPVRAAS